MKLKKIFLVILVGFLIFNKNVVRAAAVSVKNPFQSDGLNIVAIDLGGETTNPDEREKGSYGEAIIVEQNGNYLLMDAGKKVPNSQIVIDYLKQHSINHLSIYLSHYHADHYGSIIPILKDDYFTVDKLYLPNVDGYIELNTEENKTKSWYDLVVNRLLNPNPNKGDIAALSNAVENANKNRNTNTTIKYLRTGDTIHIGEATLNIIWYNFDAQEKYKLIPDNARTANSFKNNSSLVAMIEYKGIKYFTGGDIEEEVEQAILNNNINIKSDIMKLSHHSSNFKSNTKSFLETVNPKYAFTTNGDSTIVKDMIWFGDVVNPIIDFKSMAELFDETANLASTLYNGTILYNISPTGVISTDLSRNYSTITIKYLDENKNRISDDIIFKVNNKSKAHFSQADLIKKLEHYNLVSIDNDIENQIIENDITINCIYKLQKFTILFDSAGGNNIDYQLVGYNNKVIKPQNPTREGYTFLGWQLNGNDYNFDSLVTSNITLTAKWDELFDYRVNNYIIDEKNKYINKVKINTTVSEYKKNIELNNMYTVDVDYKIINSKNLLYTGSNTRIYKNNDLYDQYINIVDGDINGDGLINSADLLKIRQHLLNINILSNYNYIAADTNNDNILNSADLLRIRQHLLNIKNL